jgi:heavy metal sensor kinase
MNFTRSIRWRLQVWHALLLTAVIAGFGITAHRLASSDKLRAVDQELQSHVARLGIAIPPPVNSEVTNRPPPKPGVGVTEQITASGAHFIVWDAEGRVQSKSANWREGIEKPSNPQAGENTLMRTNGGMRQAVHFTGGGRCFIVGKPIGREMAELRQLGGYLILAGAGVLTLGLLGGWWMATRAIRPIASISETAEKIATGDLSQRIPSAKSEDELGRLASVLNSTFSRLDAAFTQQARFTADAAHELRTPVTAVLMHAQNGLATTPLTDEQRDSFESCQRAAQRMKRLIDSLLELSRLDAGQEPMKRTTVHLNEVAEDCLDMVQALAEARNITLETQLEAVTCQGDAMRLGQVITNLLTNAIEHTRDCILITTRRENGHAILTVSDNGPGIPSEHLPHLFDRFYRAEASRTRGADHNGLGLAISKAIVDAHGGEIAIESKEANGTQFVLQVPSTGS